MASQPPEVSSSPGTPALPLSRAGSEEPKDLALPFQLGNPLLVAPVPSTLVFTGDSAKVIMKVKSVSPAGAPGPPERHEQKNQTFIVTQTAVKVILPMAGVSFTPALPSADLSQILPHSKPMLLPGSSVLPVFAEGEDSASTKRPGQGHMASPGHLAWKTVGGLSPTPLIPQCVAPGPLPPGACGSATARPLGDMSCSSKGVYENFRRWQQYKVLVRRHFPSNPDTEALACFLIPVLRSLARLKPEMKIEEGIPRAMQEWERVSNFDRMVFFEMAEKFMEFEEEELQMQKAQLSTVGQNQQIEVAAPIDANKQQVYFPKKSACKVAQPKRRQRKPAKPAAPPAAKEVPPEALEQYMEIMAGLRSMTEEHDEEAEEQEDASPELLNYIHQLCDNQMFVSKVEAVINPSFLAGLLSPKQKKDPLSSTEELDEEEGLSIDELVQKRLLSIETLNDSNCSTQSGSTPSQSDEEDETPKADANNSITSLRLSTPENSPCNEALNKTTLASGDNSRMMHSSSNASAQRSYQETLFGKGGPHSRTDTYTDEGSFREKKCQVESQRDKCSWESRSSKGQYVLGSPISEGNLKTTLYGIGKPKIGVTITDHWLHTQTSEHEYQRETLIPCSKSSLEPWNRMQDEAQGICMDPLREVGLVRGQEDISAMHLPSEKNLVRHVAPLQITSLSKSRTQQRKTIACENIHTLVVPSHLQLKNTKSQKEVKLFCAHSPNNPKGKPVDLPRSTCRKVGSESLASENNRSPGSEKFKVGSFAAQLGLAPLLPESPKQCSTVNTSQLLKEPSFFPKLSVRATHKRNSEDLCAKSSDEKIVAKCPRSTSPQSGSEQELDIQSDPKVDLTCHEVPSPSYFDKPGSGSHQIKNIKVVVTYSGESSPSRCAALGTGTGSCLSKHCCSLVIPGKRCSAEGTQIPHLSKDNCESEASSDKAANLTQSIKQGGNGHKQEDCAAAKACVASLVYCKGTDGKILCREDSLESLTEREFSCLGALSSVSSLNDTTEFGEKQFGTETQRDGQPVSWSGEDKTQEHQLSKWDQCGNLECWEDYTPTSGRNKNADNLNPPTELKAESGRVCNVATGRTVFNNQQRNQEYQGCNLASKGSQFHVDTTTKECIKQETFKSNELKMSVLQVASAPSVPKAPPDCNGRVDSLRDSDSGNMKFNLQSSNVKACTDQNCRDDHQHRLGLGFSYQVDSERLVTLDAIGYCNQEENRKQHPTITPKLKQKSVNEASVLHEEMFDNAFQRCGSKAMPINTWLISGGTSQEAIYHPETTDKLEGKSATHDSFVLCDEEDGSPNSFQHCTLSLKSCSNFQILSANKEIDNSSTQQLKQQSSRNNNQYLMQSTAPDLNETSSNRSHEHIITRIKTRTLISDSHRGQSKQFEPQGMDTHNSLVHISLQSSTQQEGQKANDKRGNCKEQPAGFVSTKDQHDTCIHRHINCIDCCPLLDYNKNNTPCPVHPNPDEGNLENSVVKETPAQSTLKSQTQVKSSIQSSYSHILSKAEETTFMNQKQPILARHQEAQFQHAVSQEDKCSEVCCVQTAHNGRTSLPKATEMLPDRFGCLIHQKNSHSSDCINSMIVCYQEMDRDSLSIDHAAPKAKENLQSQESIHIIPTLDNSSFQEAEPVHCSSSDLGSGEEEENDDGNVAQFYAVAPGKLQPSTDQHWSVIPTAPSTTYTSVNKAGLTVGMTCQWQYPEVFKPGTVRAVIGQDNGKTSAGTACHHVLQCPTPEQVEADSSKNDQDYTKSSRVGQILTRHQRKQIGAKLLRRSKRLKTN
ncbi:NUT family member 1 isoform X2 [Lissotriton helveticus]